MYNIVVVGVALVLLNCNYSAIPYSLETYQSIIILRK